MNGDRRVFDSHFHVIDPRFGLAANEGYVPSPYSVDDYMRSAQPLGVVGGAVVAGSFHAASTSDDELRDLDRRGVRAARANLRRGMATMTDVDHLGLSAAGLPALLRLVARGHHVKATGFGRFDMDVASTLQAIAAVDPRALLFGTDLPSTRSPRPFDAADVALVVDALGPDVSRQVLYDNAVSLYGPVALDHRGTRVRSRKRRRR